MISPEEIKKQADKWWKPLLQSEIRGEAFFPRTIERIGKVKPEHITHRFEALQQEIELLWRHSKNQTGSGYLIKTAGQNFRRSGSHELPDAIVFETTGDYLSFTRRKKEWKNFLSNFDAMVRNIPSLKEWAFQNCVWLTSKEINWEDIIKVCQYFIRTPRPNLYVRQLPIEIHTKFIEDNATLLQSLLDFLIPDHIRSANQKRLAERYFLKYDEPLVRMRFLDRQQTDCGHSDISIPLSDFEKFNPPVKNIVIAENKMNFLALPPAADSMAVWSGGGFNIGFLKEAKWLSGKNIYYWGDIDEHGFLILHQLRTYFPNTQSLMMERETFHRFIDFAVRGGPCHAEELLWLTSEEREMFSALKHFPNKNRLEQEKIPQAYAAQYIREKILMVSD